MVKLIVLLLIPTLTFGQFVPKVRPMVIPKRDSANILQYAINSMVFNNGATEVINLFNVRNGNWLSIPQDTFMLSKYRGKNDGQPDTLLWIRRGNVKMSPFSEVRVPFSQLTGTATTAQLPTIPYTKISGGPVLSGRTPVSVTRSFNSAFTPSVTNDVLASYTVTIQMPLTLLGLVYGSVFMEISSNGTTWTQVGVLGNGNSAIVGSGAVSAQLSFLIPAGYQVRLRTAVQGSVTITYNNGFETII